MIRRCLGNEPFCSLEQMWGHSAQTKATREAGCGPAGRAIALVLTPPWTSGRGHCLVLELWYLLTGFRAASITALSDPPGLIATFHRGSFYDFWGFLDGSSIKESACNAGDAGDSGSIPGSGRSPEGGNGNLLWFMISHYKNKGHLYPEPQSLEKS